MNLLRVMIRIVRLINTNWSYFEMISFFRNISFIIRHKQENFIIQ